MAGSSFGRHGRLVQGQWSVWLAAAFIIGMLALRSSDILAGTMPDNDDLMRLQQVRDLMAGQDWFMVDQSRFLTPEGGAMHWSRLPDLFMVGVIALLAPIIGQDNGEAVAASAWPLVVLCWTIAAFVIAARRLGVGVPGQVVGLAFLATSAAIYNFWPGRIDHHNLVVALTMTALAAALSPRLSVRSGAVAAASIAAMISVAIESLPYAGVLVLGFGIMWIVRGHREGVRLAAFGVSLSFFAALFYLLDAPGPGVRRAVCDAFGHSHLAGLLGGGVLLAALGSLGGGLSGWTARLGAGALAGAATLALVVAVNPACLGDPYAGVSDQARLAWLSAVGEARGLERVWRDEPARVIWQFGFVIAGLVSTVAMALTARGDLRLNRSLLGLLMGVAALATVWQIRGVTFSHVFAALAAGWLVGSLIEAWWERRGIGPVLALTAAAVAVAPISWKAASHPFERPSKYALSDKPYSELCLDPEAYRSLPEAPSMRVFTPIDLGMSVLVRTHHAVFAGPYHRNVQGIERVTDVFMGPSDEARGKLTAIGADHLLYCAGLTETARYGQLRPGSFAAGMEAGNVPDWLVAIDGKTGTDGVVRLYAIMPEGAPISR